MSRRKAPVHRPNGPYLPVGDLGGEYCVKCRAAWPCQDASTEPVVQEYRIEKCGGLTVYHPIKREAEVIVFTPSKDFGSDWSTELPLAA